MRIILLIIFTIFMNNVSFASEGDMPKVESKGAVLIDLETGRVLWEHNSKEELAMASTTKIMTAILVLELANLQDIVKISHRSEIAPEVKMGLKKDEEIKLEYLLYALMLQSSNDAAVAIAEHISGNVEEFCALMTKKAQDIGAFQTVFETPNGLDKGEHHSTAYDMALIARYALKVPGFLELINTKEVSASSNKRSYNIVNKNRLLSEYQGANGIKTGFTGKAGHCFVGAAKRDDMQLISVVLASGWGDKGKEQKWKDTKEILNYGFDNFDYYMAVEQDDQIGFVPVTRSKTKEIEIMYAESLKIPMSLEEKEKLNIFIDMPQEVKAPVDRGQVIGEARVCIEDGVVYKHIPLVSNGEASRHDLKTSMEKIINFWLELGSNIEVNTKLPEF